MRKGKLIIFYGINNLGKTTQANLLSNRLNSINKKADYLKYAVYNLEPTGKLINSYLRENNPYDLSSREFQILQTFNREQFQPELLKKLNSGTSIVAEDYTGTGLSWGIANGVDRDFLEYINSHLYKEDISFLFTGKRFSTGREFKHSHESNDELTKRAERAHLELAEKFGWIKINANRSIQEVSDEIFDKVKSLYEDQELKFYFATTVMGDRSNLDNAKEIVSILKNYGVVLSEHLVRDDVFEFEKKNIENGVNIYERDINWVNQSDYVIVEGSGSSFGIGREVERAVTIETPVLFLYKKQFENKISKMALHDKRLKIVPYEEKDQLKNIIKDFLNKN